MVLLASERVSATLSLKELPSSDVALADEGTRIRGVEGSICSAAAVIGCMTGALVCCTAGVGLGLGLATRAGRCRALDLEAILSLFHSVKA